MIKFNDWEIRLAEFVKSRAETPFGRGSHDCALFACDCVLAQTGTDPGKWFRGRYNTKAGATKALRKYGGTLAEVADKIMSEHRCPAVNPKLAQRGDMVLLEVENGMALGIVDFDGEGVLLADAGQPIGVARVPLSLVTKAWRIG